MSKISIKATFVWPKYAEVPELAIAWDEFCIDAAEEMNQLERDRRIASCGDDLRPSMVRDVWLAVDLNQIKSRFISPTISATVSEDES
jgi:hypothetical protein